MMLMANLTRTFVSVCDGLIYRLKQFPWKLDDSILVDANEIIDIMWDSVSDDPECRDALVSFGQQIIDTINEYNLHSDPLARAFLDLADRITDIDEEY